MKKIFLSSLWALVLSFFQICHAQGDAMTQAKTSQEAIFAMGCFWCGAAAFADHDTNEKFPGIISVTVGYTGGTSSNPTYPAHEGHQEAVKVTFDPDKITYEQVLDIFWHNVDLFDNNGQFCDKGASYKSAIFYENDDQKTKALKSKQTLEKQLKRTIVTEMKAATPFYDAEDYHQDYKIKNPVRYKIYRWNCGRDQRLKEIWQ